MGPDPFNMPSFGGAQNFGSFAQQDVQQAAPLATEWHGTQGAIGGAQIPQVANISNAPQAHLGVLASFAHFLGSVATEGGHIIGAGASLLGHTLSSMATSPVHFTEGIYRGVTDRSQINQNMAQTKQFSDELNNLHSQYKAGRISKQDYQSGLKDLGQNENKLIQSETSLQNRIKTDQSNTVQSAVNFASAAAALVSGGTSLLVEPALASLAGDTGVAAAADFMGSSAADSFMTSVESSLKSVAADQAAFKALTPAAQQAARMAVLDTVQNSGARITAAQVARASAVKLAFTAPLTYAALSSTGNQLYAELDQKKYGAAVRTAAFNALLFAGGPIYHALKYGGTVAKNAVFGQTAFWDELSKYYGTGATDGFTSAINKITGNMSEADSKELIKNLSAVEATNIHAMGGNVAEAAARVALGMKNTYGFDLSGIDHETAINDMVKFAKNQRLVDEIAKATGLSGVTAGRFDARDTGLISAKLSPAMETGGQTGALQAWEDLKAANPSQSWANNQNVDRQIKNLINKYPDSASLDNAIRDMGAKASFRPKGFPVATAQQMAKDGYIPIKPVFLEAPFKEGTGTIATKFADPSKDFFLQTTKPLPILSHLGDALTGMGLSPNASTDMVRVAFNDNLSKNLIDSGVGDIGRFVGENPQQTADTLVKQLSAYAYAPTRGGIRINGQSVRPPITDLRQLTIKDIQAALGMSAQDAGKVRDALSSAMLQVPLSIRGAGDRLVDIARKVPGYQRYLSTQGAARFAWNPFFKVKLYMKTESLAQLESSGKLLTLPGTNTMIRAIAPETYNQIENTRGLLRSAGVFDEKGVAGFAGAEGVADSGVASANLTHHLMPSQERSISSLIIKQAQRAGMEPEDFIHTFPKEVRDTVQAIVGYDRNANFLNSPLARTINYAFFPFRFNLKVAGFMAKALSRQPALTQFAVLHGIYNGSTWLNSPEGQAWYSKNSEVLGLLKYFTPLETISSVSHILGQQPHSVGDFGELGGLPFGWIPQLLDAEGITHGLTQSPYVSPKTGQPLPSYIPATSKGQLLVALQDFIGSLFTYPGATVGLPSKTGITRSIAIGLTGANKNTDLTLQQPQIPSGLQSFSQAVQSTQPQQQKLPPNAIQGQTFAQMAKSKPATPYVPTNPVIQGITVPRGTSAIDNMSNKGSSSSSKSSKSSKSTKLKKSQFKPALLPGQTQFGQL